MCSFARNTFLRLYSSHLSHKLGVCYQDGSGRVDLESLKDGELDYGCDQAGLAELRKRTRKAVHNYEGVITSCGLTIHLMGRQSK